MENEERRAMGRRGEQNRGEENWRRFGEESKRRGLIGGSRRSLIKFRTWGGNDMKMERRDRGKDKRVVKVCRWREEELGEREK